MVCLRPQLTARTRKALPPSRAHVLPRGPRPRRNQALQKYDLGYNVYVKDRMDAAEAGEKP